MTREPASLDRSATMLAVHIRPVREALGLSRFELARRARLPEGTVRQAELSNLYVLRPVAAKLIHHFALTAIERPTTIRPMRAALGIEREMFAKAASIPPGRFAAIERGESLPNDRERADIARALAVALGARGEGERARRARAALAPWHAQHRPVLYP